MFRKATPALLAVCLATGAASADFFSLNVNFSFGSDPATGYVQADFLSTGAKSVRLTLTAIGFSDDEWMSSFYFNFTPEASVTGLSFGTSDNNINFGSPPWAFTGADLFKPDGDGKLDIRINFVQNGDDRFGQDDVAVIDITSLSDISAASFELLGTPGSGEGNPGPFFAVARMQTTDGGEGSDWLGATAVVPLPAAVWAGLAGLGMVGATRWKRLKAGQ